MSETTFTLIRRALLRPVHRATTRRDLAAQINDPHRLNDIGISRREAMAEVAKPFWRV